MDRRKALTLIGSTAVLESVAFVKSAAAQETTDAQHTMSHEGRRQTGKVDFILSGKRSKPLKNGDEILQVAKTAEFFDAAKHSVNLAEATLEYVPAVLPKNALAVAIMQGMVNFKIVVNGTPPIELDYLGEGTFYSYVDFIEGPDYSAGRWIARIVDESGKVRKLITGVEVRQLYEMHVDEKLQLEHSKPSIHTHGLAVGSEDETLAAGSKVFSSSWLVTNGDWVAAGSGCARTQTCTPMLQ